jgi:hypothetical protein
MAACSSSREGDTGSAVQALGVATTEARYYEGVDETVTLVRPSASAPAPTRVLRKNGTSQSFFDFLLEERRAVRARFGALDRRVRDRMAVAAPGKLVPVAIFLEPLAASSPVHAQLASKVRATRAQGQAALKAASAAAVAQQRPVLESLGVQVRAVGRSMPILFGSASPAVLGAIAKRAEIGTIRLDVPGTPTRHFAYTGVPNSTSYVRSDLSFNSYGYYARNQRVGVIESADCRLYDEHEAFGWAGAPSPTHVVTDVPASSCSDDKDCDHCAGLDPPATSGDRCINGTCVVNHASSVAGVVTSANDGNRYGASEAQVWFANRGRPDARVPWPVVLCNYDAIENAYGWLRDGGVTTTVEAFGCEAGDGDGLVQDWNARNYDLIVAKSAGNDDTATEPACPDTLNALCVGATNPQTDAVAFFSRYKNPAESDREEPDIAAQGVNVHLVDLSGSTEWQYRDGTSFSAPAVAAQIALLKDACGGAPGGAGAPGNGGTMDEPVVRAILRTAAYAVNPQDTTYSTPVPLGVTPTADYRDGAGIAWGWQLLDFCSRTGTGNSAEAAVKEIEPQSSPPLPQGGEFPSPKSPPGGFRGTTVWAAPLNIGETVRATLSWDSCQWPAGSNYVATDLDLYLYNTRTHHAIAYSASYFDNNEGFQITVPPGEDGDYELLVVHGASALPCVGFRERVGVAVVHGYNFGND